MVDELAHDADRFGVLAGRQGASETIDLGEVAVDRARVQRDRVRRLGRADARGERTFLLSASGLKHQDDDPLLFDDTTMCTAFETDVAAM